MVPNATALTDWMKLAEAALKSPDDAGRFNWQFPMGVFGTLRENCGNNHRMHANGKPYKILRAFLPHFNAKGLGISFEKNSSAPFEVFLYEPDQWDKMIPSVDRLESFSPKMYSPETMKRHTYYFRTLAVLRLLPDEFEHELFPKERPDLWDYRNLKIPPAEFNNFKPIPCWIYSNLQNNALSLAQPELPAQPILWPR